MTTPLYDVLSSLYRATDALPQEATTQALRLAMSNMAEQWWKLNSFEAQRPIVCNDKRLSAMSNDIDELIHSLEAMKLGLTGHYNAEATMRRNLGLNYTLKEFDRNPEQLDWVDTIREVYPDMGPKEAFRLAEQAYQSNDGVLPVKNGAR